MTKQQRPQKVLVMILLAVILLSVGQVFMKKGMANSELMSVAAILHPKTLVTVLLNPPVFFGFVLYAIALVLWLGAMTQKDVSYLHPLLSLGYIVTTLIAVFALQEHVSLIRWIGTIAVMTGSIFITRS